ncbi:MAG: ABC transporter permease subunit, partial [Bilifractor sp.]|nr:ABC transporter permease subunit [Bilifractor sp.]
MWTGVFHVKNTIWALIFPTLLMNGFFIILYKNNFATNIHPALIEAAKIDGAGEWYIYFKIILPLSLPILATIGLMVGLGYWNDWANGLYYITDTNLYSLQLLLKSIIDNIRNLANMSVNTGSAAASLPSNSIRMAMAVVGIIPVMVLYPFFQKAFVAGISLGGVKE